MRSPIDLIKSLYIISFVYTKLIMLINVKIKMNFHALTIDIKRF